MDKVPFICLSDNCDIVYLSEDIMSCPGKSVDRTLLLCSMSESDAERLTEFCLSPAIPKSADFSDIINTVHFHVKLHRYRYAVAKKSETSDNITTLYLFRNESDAICASCLGTNTLNLQNLSEAEPLWVHLSSVLRDDCYIDIGEVAPLLQRTASHLASSGTLFGRGLTVHTNASSPLQGCSVSSAPLLLAFVGLTLVLDCVCTTSEITVTVCANSDSFEVVMSAVSNTAPPIVGTFSHIIALAPYLPGCYTDLTLACYGAVNGGLHISAVCSPDSEFKFTISHMPEHLPPLEFKFSDPDEFAEKLIADVLCAVSAIKQQKNEEQKHLSAVFSACDSQDK